MPTSRSPTFLTALVLTPEEADKLRQLGCDTPEQLLAQIRAAPGAFADYLGSGRAPSVQAALERLVQGPPSAFEPIAPPGALGVPLDSPTSPLPPPTVDLARRDRLFERLQQLRRESAPPERIDAAERELEALLAGAARPAPGPERSG